MLPQQALKTNGNSAPPQNKKSKPPRLPRRRAGCRHERAISPGVERIRRLGGGFNAARGDHRSGHSALPRATSGEMARGGLVIVIPEFSAWLTLVLEQCRAENIRNLPRQRAPTPLFPERRPREACSMPISGCHDLPLATFNLPSRVFRHGCRRASGPERRPHSRRTRGQLL